MTVIILLGVDGAGKSTVLKGIQGRLSRVNAGEATMHFRPHILPALARFRGQVSSGSSDAPHRRKPARLLASVIRLAYVWIDYIAWYSKLFFKGKSLVLFDRHFIDQLIDPRRYGIDAAPVWLVRFLAWTLPRADLVVILVGEPSVVWSRKKEIELHEITRQQTALRTLGRFGCKTMLIDTTTHAAEECIRMIVAEIPAQFY